MNKQRYLYGLATPILLWSLFIGGCVTKGRFLSEVDQNKQLTQQLENENTKISKLNKEKDFLKERLEAIHHQANLKEKEQFDLIRAQANQITLLETQREKTENLSHQLKSEKQNITRKMDQLRGVLSAKEREAFTLASQLSSESQKSGSLEEMLREAEKLTEKRMLDAEETATARNNLIKNLEKEIREGNIKISQMNNRLSIQIVSKILFPSGSDQVTGEGKRVLKKVSDTLKTIEKNKIQIEGHTDNVPIGADLVGRFPSNWELSTARATQVVKYLAQEKVDPKNLVAVGMAQYAPVASNDSPEGRQENRRIEIILTPKFPPKNP